MILELTTDNIIQLSALGGSVIFGLWARSMSVHNKLSEQRSEALKKDIEEVKKDAENIQKANNDLRDCLQETRENYVTNARFEAFVTEIKIDIKSILSKFDSIMQKLEEKKPKDECFDCISVKTKAKRIAEELND